jgi:hypothetical protein
MNTVEATHHAEVGLAVALVIAWRRFVAGQRPSTGTWYVLTSSSARQTFFVVAWGMSADVPVPGDFDGDGKVDKAAWRPSSGTWWILQSKTNYSTFLMYAWGTGGDIPILRRP